MTDLVDKSKIESIVGVKRSDRLHYGRKIGSTIYILHSGICEKNYDDLRDCPFSYALDYISYQNWDSFEQDRTYVLGIHNGSLTYIRKVL